MSAPATQIREVHWPIIRRVQGDLRLHGDLVNQNLVIGGNLVVDGLIENCQLYVGGHLTATGVLNSRLEVEGDLESHYLRKCQFRVEGNLCISGETAFSQGEVQGLALPGWVVESRILSNQHILAKGVITNRQGGSLLWAGFGRATPHPEQSAMLVVLERLDAGTRLQIHREGTLLTRKLANSAFTLCQQKLVRWPLPEESDG